MYNKLNLPLSSTALSLALPFPSLPHAFATVGQPLLWRGKKVEGEVTSMVGIYTIRVQEARLVYYTDSSECTNKSIMLTMQLILSAHHICTGTWCLSSKQVIFMSGITYLIGVNKDAWSSAPQLHVQVAGSN